jgi:hypothetical protein
MQIKPTTDSQELAKRMYLPLSRLVQGRITAEDKEDIADVLFDVFGTDNSHRINRCILFVTEILRIAHEREERNNADES